ncbi:MAG TPA: PP2C family protein-serine/threonine phosphatase [Thermoanaerobaculia bacterium]|nr:PP2C family protein-serine/threonine phosphatase [Thermoanaerobaculia bacterium]
MDLTYSLDEVARTTDDVIVRRRFDQRNRFWLQVLLSFYAFVTLLLVMTRDRRNTPLDVLLGVATLAFIVLIFWVARESYRAQPRALGRWFQRHVTASVITYVFVQYAVLLFLTNTSDGENWAAWVMVMPWTVVALRFTLTEHVLLHAVLLFGAVMMPTVSGDVRHAEGLYIGVAVNNVLPFAIELFGAYRMRKLLRREWEERRTSARAQIRMRDELRYARELQLSMLPECAPPLEWAELCAISLPATEVGGDYYDYFVDGDRVALVCGDVAGHGMASGLVLSALRSGFTLLRDSLGDPGSVLRRLHDLVAQTSRRRMLVTVTVVLLDRAMMRATIASAGHPPVIVRRADGSVEMINLYAPPLGVRLPVTIPQTHLDVAPGDVFVLHSDGVYETRNPAGESYGLERLASVVRDHDGTAESLRDAILADVERFRGGELPDDDVTVVVAKMA